MWQPFSIFIELQERERKKRVCDLWERQEMSLGGDEEPSRHCQEVCEAEFLLPGCQYVIIGGRLKILNKETWFVNG